MQLWDALDAEGAGVNALPDEAINCRKVKPGTARHSSCLRIRRDSAEIASAHVACFAFVLTRVASVALCTFFRRLRVSSWRWFASQEMRKTVRLIRRQLEAGGCSSTKSAQLEALEALFLFVGIQVRRCQL